MVMKKNILKKDFIREITKNKGRFLSIFFIVMLGTAFFAGIRSSGTDMKYSADVYYKKAKLMDIRVISTLGLTDDDIQDIGDLDTVESVTGAYTKEVLVNTEDSQKVFKLISMTDGVNEAVLTEGRMPEKENECLLDLAQTDYKIGDVIKVESGTDDELSDTLDVTEFTVVGFGSMAYYMDLTRGVGSIGSGTVSAFMVIPKTAFCQDYYSEAYVQVKNAENYNSYSDEYQELVDAASDEIEGLEDSMGQRRYDEIIADGRAELDDGWKEVNDGEKELQDARNELDDAKAELDDGKKELDDAKAELDDGEKQLKDSEVKLADAKAELDDAKAELESNKAKLDSAAAQLDSAAAQLADGKAQLDSAKATLDAAAASIEEGRTQLAAGLAEYDSNKALLDAAWEEYNTNKAAFEEQKAEFLQLQAAYEQAVEQYAQVQKALEADPENQELLQQAAVLSQTITALKAQIDAAAPVIEAAEAKLNAAYTQLTEKQAELDAAKAVLDEKQAELTAAETQYNEGLAAYEANYQTYQASEASYEAGKAEYESGLAQYNEGLAQYNDGLAEYESGLAEYNSALQDYEEGKQKYEDSLKEYEDGLAEYEDGEADYAEAYAENQPDIDEAKKELEDGEADLAAIEMPTWYVLDRESISSAVSFGQDAERMDSLGNVFPVIFFLVAALVSLTAMTRMVDEQRQQIGTLKALGFGGASIAWKYLKYALIPTLTGGIIGVFIGESILPMVIIDAYRMMYTGLDTTYTPLNPTQGILAVVVAVICICAATIAACYKKLKEKPALLMRPEAPKSGKRVFLEYIKPVWKRLNFTAKSTIRNLFRYKKRLIMTIVGIGACMGIIMVGFGIQDSIQDVAKRQYVEIFKQDATASLDTEASDADKEQLQNTIDGISGLTDSMEVCQISVTLKNGKTERSAYLYVPQDLDKVFDFLRFRDRVTEENYDYPKEGVALAEKTANMLGVGIGDTIDIQKGDGGVTVSAKVTQIVENYVQHYCFMTENTYQELFGEKPEYNEILLKYDDDSEDNESMIGKAVINETACTSISFTTDLQKHIDDMLKTLTLIIWVLIIAGGLLAFVVIYNLNNINITERKRELATLKVLGFRDIEVAMYVYRENIILTILGIALGCVIGVVLHRFTITTVEVDLMMFGRTVGLSSYFISAAITLVFAVIVNVFMFFSLKKIDMIESLKSVE